MIWLGRFPAICNVKVFPLKTFGSAPLPPAGESIGLQRAKAEFGRRSNNNEDCAPRNTSAQLLTRSKSIQRGFAPSKAKLADRKACRPKETRLAAGCWQFYRVLMSH
jgi:hypothetical protein